MEYRADQHKRNANRNTNFSLESETDKEIHNASCASVDQYALGSDDVLIGQIDNIMHSSKTQNINSSLPILDETDEESALCNENNDMQYFTV